MFAKSGIFKWTLFKRITELEDPDAIIKVDPIFEPAWKLVCNDDARRTALKQHDLDMTTTRKLQSVTCSNISCGAAFYLPVGTTSVGVVCNNCKSDRPRRGSVLNTAAAAGSKKAAADAALALKTKAAVYYAPKPYEFDETHLLPNDDRNPTGVATTIGAVVLFLNPNPQICRITGLNAVPRLKQEMNSGGMYSPGAIVDGNYLLGPMKIVAGESVDTSDLRHLPPKVFDAAGTAWLVGFTTKTSDKSPKPLFIEWRQGRACGLTHLKDPSAMSWVKNSKAAMAWNDFETSSAFDSTDEALIISLLTVDSGILKGI